MRFGRAFYLPADAATRSLRSRDTAPQANAHQRPSIASNWHRDLATGARSLAGRCVSTSIPVDAPAPAAGAGRAPSREKSSRDRTARIHITVRATAAFLNIGAGENQRFRFRVNTIGASRDGCDDSN
jgi:hypothetical protein